MDKRIIGIDVARALALIGMIVVNFKMTFSQNSLAESGWWVGMLDGKAAATFVVLAGVGIALITRTSDAEALEKRKNLVAKRALFLFISGTLFLVIWPADILHFYGIYMLLTLLLIRRRPLEIIGTALALMLTYPLLFIFMDYETGWDFTNLSYPDLWTIKGYLRNLLFNGFHPIFPWTAFMLIGLWLGRQNFNDHRRIKEIAIFSGAGFLVLQALSLLLTGVSTQLGLAAEESGFLFGTAPMPPFPLYLLSGACIAVTIIAGCVLIGKRFPTNAVLQWLGQTGKLALTFYVAHVVIGMGLVEVFGAQSLGDYSLFFSLTYAFFFSLACVIFANWWLKSHKTGPLEWVMRYVT